ncbi:MAG TPA: glycosyltransferase family 39 protein, partial [Chthonomonadaceae bacterium]|nr:glycosyltransferase family 39 protein [Chthonomonadaceae bacterium]
MSVHPDTSRFASGRRWHQATLLFLVVTTLLRLCQLPMLELAPDEAYYWDWSRRLALGYYDQGPMIAYVIRLTTALFGTNEFGVRFGVLTASLGTLLCCYALARRLFSPLAGFFTVVLLGLTPLMAVGSVIATYDPLLVCFWALACVFLERALYAPTERAQRAAWIGAGIATGLGFLSKHTMLLLVPCLLLFLALSPPHRRWLRRPEPYSAFALTLLLYSG